jgi:vancomycin resistance protein YoaR
MKRNIVIFIIVFIQTALAITAGLAAVYYSNSGIVPGNTIVLGADVGGLNKEEAFDKINETIGKSFNDLDIIFKYNENDEYKFSGTSIELRPDLRFTVENAYGSSAIERLTYLLSASFSKRSRELVPVLKYNEQMLKERIKEFSILVDVKPSDAKIIAADGKIEKVAEKNGLKINIDKFAAAFREYITNKSDYTIELSSLGRHVFETVKPSVTMQDFEGIDSIISEYSVQIADDAGAEFAALVSAAVNGKILEPSHNGKPDNSMMFSFNDCMSEAGIIKGENDALCNLAASALYAAILEAGIDIGQISRVRNETCPDYIEPGLDVKVMGADQDLRFSNTGSGKIMIQSEINGNKLYMRVLGKAKDENAESRIETKVVQVFKPSIINIEDSSLGHGEKVVLNEGKDGLKVDVFRNIYRNGIKAEEKYLYTDVYEPVGSVVKIGPHTGWTRNTDK